MSITDRFILIHNNFQTKFNRFFDNINDISSITNVCVKYQTSIRNNGFRIWFAPSLDNISSRSNSRINLQNNISVGLEWCASSYAGPTMISAGWESRSEDGSESHPVQFHFARRTGRSPKTPRTKSTPPIRKYWGRRPRYVEVVTRPISSPSGFVKVVSICRRYVIFLGISKSRIVQPCGRRDFIYRFNIFLPTRICGRMRLRNSWRLKLQTSIPNRHVARNHSRVSKRHPKTIEILSWGTAEPVTSNQNLSLSHIFMYTRLPRELFLQKSSWC